MTPSPYFPTYLRHVGTFRILNWLYDGARIDVANQWRERIPDGSLWLAVALETHGEHGTGLAAWSELADVEILYSNGFNYLRIQ